MTITVDRVKGIYLDPGASVRVGHRYGRVILSLKDKQIEFDTPTAVKVGLSLVKLAALVDSGEFINLKINGSDVHLLPEVSTNLGGAILRKADAADDWQRAIH